MPGTLKSSFFMYNPYNNPMWKLVLLSLFTNKETESWHEETCPWLHR